jgi:hypothetical protein
MIWLIGGGVLLVLWCLLAMAGRQDEEMGDE